MCAERTKRPGVSGKARVAVVIPCFQHAQHLRGAIESVLGQTVRAAEIIVVDDGSTDRPEEVTRAFPKVRLIVQENRGLAGARNTGLRKAKSDKIIFLDADDRLLPEAVATGLAAFERNPGAAFVYGAYREVRRFRDTERFRAVETRCDLVRSNGIGMIASVMFDRKKLLAAGGFDESLGMCEDWDAYLRLSREWPFALHRDAVARYVRHRGNMSNDVTTLKAWIEVVRQKERRRGLTDDEQAAWQEGIAVLAENYPNPLRRIVQLFRRIRPPLGR